MSKLETVGLRVVGVVRGVGVMGLGSGGLERFGILAHVSGVRVYGFRRRAQQEVRMIISHTFPKGPRTQIIGI